MYPFFDKHSPKTSFPLLDEAAEHFTTPNAAGNVRPSTLSSILAFLFKRSAKHLRSHLSRVHGLELTHGQALDAVSAGVGCADWNTVQARVQQLGLQDQGGLESTAAHAEAAARAHGAWRQGQLSKLLDFDANTLVLGAAGTGKSVGVLFALQAKPNALTGRPLMVVHGHDSDRYQPNWSGFLRTVPNAQPWVDAFTASEASADDRVIVTQAPLARMDSAAASAVRQRALKAGLIQWLTARAHLKPLLLVDDVYAVLGDQANSLLAEVPAGVVIVWLAQVISDFGDLPLAETFDRALLMRWSHGLRGGEALGLAAKQVAQVEERLDALSVGQALVVPFAKPADAPARQPREMVFDAHNQLLRARLFQAIQLSLPQVRIHHPTLPRNIPVSAWKSGDHLCVLEVKLREIVRGQLSAEDNAVLERMQLPGAPVKGLSLAMLEVLDGAGWLVCEHGGVVLPCAAALWNIQVGKLDYKGVLVLQIRGQGVWDFTGDSTRVPVVTGPLFVEPNETRKRLASLLDDAASSNRYTGQDNSF